MEIIKLLGRIEIEKEELENKLLEGKKYLITYNNIYEVRYSKNASFNCLKIYTNYKPLPLMGRGRYLLTTAKHINDLVERKLVEDI